MWPWYPHDLTRDWWYIEFLTMWANSNPWEVDFERISALKWKSHQIDHVTEQILFYKHYLMPICPILLNVTHFKYYKIIINCNKLPSVTQTLWHKFSDFETLWESFFDPALSQSNVLQCCLNSEKYQTFSRLYTKIRPVRTAVHHNPLLSYSIGALCEVDLVIMHYFDE